MCQQQTEDLFVSISQKLERLAELKEKHGFDNAEADYEEIRRSLISQMKQAINLGVKAPELISQSDTRQELSLSYSQLHLQIVNQISAGYKGGNEEESDEYDKIQMLKAVSSMAEKRALFSGDSKDIEEVIDIVYTPLPSVSNTSSALEVSGALLKPLQELNKVYVRVKDNPNSSPAAKAVVEITCQSAYQASEEIGIQASNPDGMPKPIQRLWRNLVLPDLKGCLHGGEAASMFATAFFPVSLPVFATIGIIVGAGIGSGEAYKNLKKNS